MASLLPPSLPPSRACNLSSTAVEGVKSLSLVLGFGCCFLLFLVTSGGFIWPLLSRGELLAITSTAAEGEQTFSLLLGFDGLQLSATGEKKEEDGVE